MSTHRFPLALSEKHSEPKDIREEELSCNLEKAT
jgi:hypothetical protein